MRAAAPLDPEVLSVFVPPFVSKEDGPEGSGTRGTLAKPRRRSFRKKRDRPKVDGGRGALGGPLGQDPEDISIPDGVDLLALPQLCFPGTGTPCPCPALREPPRHQVPGGCGWRAWDFS